MTIIVEDGTGLASANSYASLAYADAYADAHHDTLWQNATLAVKEAGLLQATTYLDGHYTWPGFVAYDAQALGWPRIEAYDSEGRWIAVAEVPARVKDACCYLAGRAVTQELEPVAKTPVKRKKVASLEIEYGAGGDLGQRSFPEVDSMLRMIVASSPEDTGASAVRWS